MRAIRLSSLDPFFRGGDDGVGRDAEMSEKVGRGRGGAKTFHADEGAVVADPAVPAEARGGLDSYTRRRTQHRAAIIIALALEQFPTGHGHDGGLDAL